MGNRLVLALLIVAALCLPLSSKAASAAPWPIAFQTANSQSPTGTQFGVPAPGGYTTYLCAAEVSNAVYGSWNSITIKSLNANGLVQFHANVAPIAKAMVWNTSAGPSTVPAPITGGFQVNAIGGAIGINALSSTANVFNSVYGLQQTLGITSSTGSNTLTYKVASQGSFVAITVSCSGGCSSVNYPSGCSKDPNSISDDIYLITCETQSTGSYQVKAIPVQPSSIHGCANTICTTEVAMQAAVFPLSTKVLDSDRRISTRLYSPNGEDSTYNSAISAYQNVIANGGLNNGHNLSSLYVELDSPNYTKITGLATPIDTGNWTVVKTAINNLEIDTGAQYVVVLGNSNMSSNATRESTRCCALLCKHPSVPRHGRPLRQSHRKGHISHADCRKDAGQLHHPDSPNAPERRS